MGDLERRYSRLVTQIAELVPEDEPLFVFLRGLKVDREEWDVGRGRGNFFFEETAEHANVELIEMIADDVDGVVIEIAVHITGQRRNWGEWHRSDARPVLRWPPSSVLPKSRLSKRLRESDGESGANAPGGRYHSAVGRRDGGPVDEITSRYAPMIAQIAAMYSGDDPIYAQLRSLIVTREEWDTTKRGGHFWFSVSGPAAERHDFLVEAQGYDVDGAMIDIILHPVDGILNWGEWYRVPLNW